MPYTHYFFQAYALVRHPGVFLDDDIRFWIEDHHALNLIVSVPCTSDS